MLRIDEHCETKVKRNLKKQKKDKCKKLKSKIENEEEINEILNVGLVLKGITTKKYRKLEKYLEEQGIYVVFVKRASNTTKLRIVETHGEIRNGSIA